MELLDIYRDQSLPSLIGNVAQDRNQLEEFATAFVLRLSQVSAVDPVFERLGTTILVKDDGTSVQIDSPFGHAWAELTVGIDSNSVQGFWHLWKRINDDDGQPSSSLVATIRFTKHGQVFLGPGNESPLSAKRNILGGDDLAAYQVLQAILYAIGAH